MVEDLENAPAAFLGLLQGKNFGKLLVKVAWANQRQPERSFDPCALEEALLLDTPPPRYGGCWWDWGAAPKIVWTGLCGDGYGPLVRRPTATVDDHGKLETFSWSARVIIGAAVFALGVLAGAGIAAWLVPPV
jgi:hypothetical protein